MAAVVGPIGVHHPNFGDGGVPVLLVPEIGLQKFQVVQIHGKAQLIQQFGKSGFVHANKAGDGSYRLRNRILNRQRLRHIERRFPALHGVDDVLLDGSQLVLTYVAGKDIDLGGANGGAVALRDDLDALGGGVGPLVVLTGQRLHGENRLALGHLVADVVHLGLGEHGVHGIAEQFFVHIFRIIAVQHPQPGEAVNL